MVQILVHNYKIPEKIEVQSINSQGDKAISLGSFNLQDNYSTQYKARELKTVYIDSECRYLKFVLTKNYKNSLNIFNQVGILSLTCFGELGLEPTTM